MMQNKALVVIDLQNDIKKTAELIDKIAELGGTHKADILKSNMVCFNTRKHSNESI